MPDYPHHTDELFLAILYIATFVGDVIYLLYRSQRRSSQKLLPHTEYFQLVLINSLKSLLRTAPPQLVEAACSLHGRVVRAFRFPLPCPTFVHVRRIILKQIGRFLFKISC